MILIFTAVSFFVLGRELAMRIWRRDDLVPAERITAAATIGFALWIGTLWVFALTGALIAAALAVRNILVAVAAAALWLKRGREGRVPERDSRALIFLAAAVPIALWAAFILWRGAVVPPLSHDALAYHLPKAVAYARSAGYDPLPAMPARARNIPVNYELMLADAILIGGGDAHSEWPSVFHYLTFIAAGVALAQRWWGAERFASTTVALLLAGVPVALLHSGAQKNDLMTAAFMTASLVWIGRYLSKHDIAALILGASALAMAFGTKPQAAVLAVACLPFVLWRMFRGGRSRDLWKAAGASVVFTALLGGAYWPLDRASSPRSAATGAPVPPVHFGDWENVWQVPYVLITAPFSRLDDAIAVPWDDVPWFWRRYELYFSELGIVFSVCALLLPLAIWRLRKSRDESRFERLAITAIAGATFASMLPIVFRPLGMYAISTPRYVLFIVPMVFAWTVAPLVASARRSLQTVAVVAAFAVFSMYAYFNATRDPFVPTDYLAFVRSNPGTRVIPFDPNRAASLLDRAAAADARVAVEASDGTWIYPAYGSALARDVVLIRAGAPAAIPDVEWIAIDRKFTTVWKHPSFENLGQSRRYILRGGSPLDADPLVQAIRADGRWRLVYSQARTGQALFQRVR